mgnify:CR=1 FL=1
MEDKETMAQLAQEMKELIPETPYSRLVKKLSNVRRRDRIIQRNCCCLLMVMFCFVIGLSIALAFLAPATYQSIYQNTVNNDYYPVNNLTTSPACKFPPPLSSLTPPQIQHQHPYKKTTNTNLSLSLIARNFQFVSMSSTAAEVVGTRQDNSDVRHASSHDNISLEVSHLTSIDN